MKFSIPHDNYEEMNVILDKINELNACDIKPHLWVRNNENEFKKVVDSEGNEVVSLYHNLEIYFAHCQEYKPMAYITRNSNTKIHYVSYNDKIAGLVKNNYKCVECNEDFEAKDSCVIMDLSNGKLNQVHMNCVTKFTQDYIIQECLIDYCNLLSKLEELQSISEDNRITPYFETQKVLDIMLELLRTYGYHFNENGWENTISIAFRCLGVKYRIINDEEEKRRVVNLILHYGFNLECEESKKYRERYKNWFENLVIPEGATRFSAKYQTLKDLLRQPYMCSDSFEQIAYIPQLMQDFNEDSKTFQYYDIQIVKNEIDSDYEGEIGQNYIIEVFDIDIVYKSPYEDSKYKIYKIKNKDGNVFIYKGVIDISLECTLLRCVIVEHSEHDGIKQTIINRISDISKRAS